MGTIHAATCRLVRGAKAYKFQWISLLTLFLRSPVMQLLPTDVFVCLAVSILLGVFFRRRLTYQRRYPPGPPSRPIIGNLLDVPKDAPWIAYAEMSRIYGMHNDLGALAPPS